MSTLCDNCNGKILVDVIGTIKGVAFHFCGPECLAEYSEFCSARHLALIPERRGDACNTVCVARSMLVATPSTHVTGLGETIRSPRPVQSVLVSD